MNFLVHRFTVENTNQTNPFVAIKLTMYFISIRTSFACVINLSSAKSYLLNQAFNDDDQGSNFIFFQIILETKYF